MYVGVRAGGGIGDEIEDPAGDPYELYRILFDITFFFFVIVILLAIIQGELRLTQLFHRAQPVRLFAFVLTGLIIDAFGELRDQQEQVKEDMEVRRERTRTFALVGSSVIFFFLFSSSDQMFHLRHR